MISRDKVRAMFMGISIGDRLGLPMETMTAPEIKQKFGRVTSYISTKHNKFAQNLEVPWSDDTDYSLLVAESLIAKKCIDMDDLAARHIAALDSNIFGSGKSTIQASKRLKAGMHWSESGKTNNPKLGKGNGVAMKVSPIGAVLAKTSLYPYYAYGYFTGGKEAKIYGLENLKKVACMTHSTPMAVASAYLQTIIIFLCCNETPERFNYRNALFMELASLISIEEKATFNELDTNEKEDKLCWRLFELLRIFYSQKTITNQEIIDTFGGGTCYVYNSPPFTYAFFFRNPTSIETLYDVVNSGGDTDSNGSMCGALLGALNGMSIFPQHLIDGLVGKEKILDVAERFCDAFNIA